MFSRKCLSIIFLILFLMLGCSKNEQLPEGFIKFDVTKKYLMKELFLQDFMDVEYIPLETNDDFVNQGYVRDIGEKNIIVTNRINDGDIFIYDRTGKALRKINRRGQGSEEYSFLYNIILDDKREEIFVNDLFAKRIVVYDLFGNFKRVITRKEEFNSTFYTNIYNYDEDNLICYDRYNTNISFFVISKNDGTVIKTIKIPFKNKLFLRQTYNNNNLTPGPYHSIMPYKGNWILLELSSDTVYMLSSDFSIHPFLVRIPSVESKESDDYLLFRFLSDHYLFMETIENKFDFSRNVGFKKKYFMFDCEENIFFRYKVYNKDYVSKKEVYMNMINPNVESWLSLESNQLILDYERGIIRGRLKDIAAKLSKDSNPVIMLIKHK